MKQLEFLSKFFESPEFQSALDEQMKEGIKKGLQEYFVGYQSPFQKELEKQLREKSMPLTFQLPDLQAQINLAMTQEADKLTNSLVAESYLPLFTKFVTRVPKRQKISDILEEILMECNAGTYDKDEYSLELEKREESYGNYLDATLTADGQKYKACFSGIGDGNFYKLFYLPEPFGYRHEYERTMTMQKGGYSLKMPFTPNVLGNPVIRILANLYLNQCEIEMDTYDFDNEMFEQICSC